MRGAPQVGFSSTIRKIRSRISLEILFLPNTQCAQEKASQYKATQPCAIARLCQGSRRCEPVSNLAIIFAQEPRKLCQATPAVVADACASRLRVAAAE